MPIFQATIEQLATVGTTVEVGAADAAAAADLAIGLAPAQDWEEAWHRSRCTGYDVLEVEPVA